MKKANLASNVEQIGGILNKNLSLQKGLSTMTTPTRINKGIQPFSIGGKNISLHSELGTRLQLADNNMFKATGQHIQITSGTRSFQDQQRLYNQLAPQGKRVAPPGTSLHEFGGAFDVGNWQQAQPYLIQAGFINPLSNDRVHFRINNGMTESQLRQLYGGQ